MKLIKNWRNWPRMFSQQLLVVDVALVSAWTQLPQEFKATIESHHSWMIAGAVGWCAIKFLARLIDQTPAAVAPPAQ